MKGVIHFHSCFSHDSINQMDSIIDKALEEDLDFLILTDHETIDGSLALRKRVEERGVKLIVPIAAEYKTDCGDFIAAFIRSEIDFASLDDFINEVRNQDGLLLLPHPYEGHPIEHMEKLVKNADLIETFNPRCTKYQDSMALEIASKHNKQTYYGSDAHLQSELCNVVVTVSGEPSEMNLKDALTKEKIIPLSYQKTFSRNITFSQFIKSFKRKKARIFFRNLVGLLIDTIRLGWNNKVN